MSQTSQEAAEQAALITSSIIRLLSHYWVATEEVDLRKAQLEDWLTDLAPFGPDAVAEACARWRIRETRRPTPADIVKLAADVQRELAEIRAATGPEAGDLRRIVRETREDRERRSVDMQREGRDIVNRWAQAKGYADLDVYCEAMGQPWVDVYREIVMEICAASPWQHVVGSWRSLGHLLGGR